MTARTADLTLAQLTGRAVRYRPLVLTVVLTLGILRFLPVGSDGESTSTLAAPTAAAAALVPPATATVADENPGPASSPDAGPGPTPAPAPMTRAPASETAPAGPPAVAATDSAATPSPTTPPSHATSVPTTQPAEPLAVVHSAWASRTAGTPASDIDVPESTLPVGTRLGDTDKASYLALAGSWSTLDLVVDGTRGSGAVIRACSIIQTRWDSGPDQRFDDAPAHDPDRCVDGVAGEGRWSFTIGTIDHSLGVALVPGPDAPLDFQVTFVDPT